MASTPGDRPDDLPTAIGFLDLRQVLDSMPDGITIQDQTFTILYMNRAMRDAFGDRVGFKCYMAYEHRDRICEQCGVERAFQTGNSVMTLRTAYDQSGGTSYWENHCFPIRDAAGAIVAGAEVCRNISDRVRLEDEVKLRNVELGQTATALRRRTDELEQALAEQALVERKLRAETTRRQQTEVELRHSQKLEAVGQLAAGIAHEINTPAQFVGDSVAFLADGFRDLLGLLAAYREAFQQFDAAPAFDSVRNRLREAEEAADLGYVEAHAIESFTRAQDGIARIAAIVGAMKEFAHTDHREKHLADLNHALQTTLTIARNEYKYVADIETAFGVLPQVPCHLGEINQVFLNLLVNAAHTIADVARPDGARGTIRVRTVLEGDYARVDISDTGSGIPADIRDRIFEPFFTTKAVGRGTGQGLAIARSVVVDKHGGTLSFETSEGAGTTFTVRLPVHACSGGTPAGPSGQKAE